MAEKAKTVATPVVGVTPAKKFLRETQISVGSTRSGDYPGTKTSGIQTRGGKAQTKGKTARGPMA